MSDHETVDRKAPPFLMAGFACLLCLPVIYLVTRPVIWLLHTQWLVWPLFALWTFVPVAAAFVVLYRSEWHREWPGVRRVFSMLLSSCIIFGVDLFAVFLLAAVGCFVLALLRAVGGN